MKHIYLSIVVLISFGSGLLISKNQYEKKPEELQEDFKRYGQFSPVYINYTDDQMLAVCDQYNLVYDFENGECS